MLAPHGDRESRRRGISARVHCRAPPPARDVERIERARGETFLLPQQPQQELFGCDVVVIQEAGLMLGQHDDLAGVLSEALEHPRSA